MALGTNQMTITTGDIFIPEIWTKKVQKAMDNNLVMKNLVLDMSEEAAGGGDLLRTPKISLLTASVKAANTQVTLNSPTETAFTMNINRHFESSYLVEDRLKAQAAYQLLQLYAPRAGQAVAKQWDSDLAGLYSGLSQTVGNSTTTVNDANIRRAMQYLDDANAPQTERYLVVKPAGVNHLRGIQKFSEWISLGISPAPNQAGGFANGSGGVVQNIGDNGFAGVVYNLKVYMSTNLVEESGTSDTVHNLVFHKEAFATAASIKPRTQFQYKQEYLGMLATSDALWGFGEYRDDFAVDFRSDDE